MSLVSPGEEDQGGKSSGRLTELQVFLKRAADRAAAEVSKQTGPYRSPAFFFARCLKAWPDFADLGAEEVTVRLDRELDDMFPSSPVPWVALGLPDQDSTGAVIDPRTDFLHCWNRVLKPLHLGGAVDEAAERADEKPIDMGGLFVHPSEAPVRRLVSICYYLAKRSPSCEFFVSCRDAGRSLGVSPTEANRLLDRLRDAGILERKPYSPKDRARRQAQGWRFLGIPKP